jgi:hypothetical protein
MCRGRVRLNGFGWDCKDDKTCMVPRGDYSPRDAQGFPIVPLQDGFDDALDGWNQRRLAGPRRADSTELNSRGVADRGAPATVF